MSGRRPKYDGIIFDMDGTLTIPTLDFKQIRGELGVPDGIDLIEAQRALSSEEKARYWAVIERHERDARRNVRFQKGLHDVMGGFERAGVRMAVMTRNSRQGAMEVLSMIGARFDPVLTREFEPVKPSPKPALHILRAWGMAPGRALVVGDYRDDLLCGRAAGCATCFFQNPGSASFADLADHVVTSFEELAAVVGLAGFRNG